MRDVRHLHVRLTKRLLSGRREMDGARFDSIARTLAGRLSRRTALRGTGAGVAAGLFVGAER